MKKQGLFFWFAAFVCAAWIFIGCPQEADDEPTAAEKAAKELGATLGGATVDGTTVTLTAETVTIAAEDEVTVPAGVTLAVPGSKTLVVASGGILNVAANANVVVNGAYQLGNGVTGTNDGTVTVASGGVINNGTGVNIGGTGTNIVQAGGTVYFNGDTKPYIGASNDTNALYRLGTGATFAYNNSGYTIGGGIVTLDRPGDGNVKVVWSTKNILLHIKAGGQLTVADKTDIAIKADEATEGPFITGEPAEGETAAARIVLSANGYVEFYLGTSRQTNPTANSPSQNFYNNSGTQVVGTLSNKTYTWNADAGSAGGDQPGWKADS